ncbi:hypothetical protein ACFYXF_28005 [Streptomyces sp. NPDC002680]|uniref:hypothetical protein n=1 Tax=Streptomyces sp. NPDC002680 TaxID=3364659 RepID=UPI0036899A1D
MNRSEWPPSGRVGLIGGGEYAGAYLLLAVEINDCWAFYISDDPSLWAVEDLRTDDFWVADADLEGVLAEMAVEWAPEAEDSLLEKAVFDARGEWERRRAKRASRRGRWFRDRRTQV